MLQPKMAETSFNVVFFPRNKKMEIIKNERKLDYKSVGAIIYLFKGIT